MAQTNSTVTLGHGHVMAFHALLARFCLSRCTSAAVCVLCLLDCTVLKMTEDCWCCCRSCWRSTKSGSTAKCAYSPLLVSRAFVCLNISYVHSLLCLHCQSVFAHVRRVWWITERVVTVLDQILRLSSVTTCFPLDVVAVLKIKIIKI